MGGLTKRPSKNTFSIPCESWGSATNSWLKHNPTISAFSIPCESWGSATPVGETLPKSISSFSIPCESWGSATSVRQEIVVNIKPDFQYSLRIVGFRDFPPPSSDRHISYLSVFPANRGVPRLDRKRSIGGVTPLSVFPANRGVPRRYVTAPYYSHVYCLSVFPANRGVPRLSNPGKLPEKKKDFQYSLRIVGFRDFSNPHDAANALAASLSVFPANRGVPRRQ